MIWISLLILAAVVFIVLSVVFERRRKKQAFYHDEQDNIKEIYSSESTAHKAADPKNSKNF
ncbi:hypothetical protein H0266_02315 [Halobacillus locisalis]|uniref:Uncharacterized protein n=1 Tax=Halobacillus locisalis TaxID=220753 RepID=A0A838CP36_9BACI|nr:hypothetical protein [Halobacillus locisalis]MBA2173724.1 hypothetical protein [Halobacillus locisalis]